MSGGDFPAWRVESLDTVPSTQDIVRARAEAGEAEGLVLRARAQNAGRGRQGTRWDSPPGNLYMSVLLRPDCSARQAGQIALVVGAALGRVLAPLTKEGARLGLKWPNDVLAGGRKLAGILVESGIEGNSLRSAVVGIGVNVGAPPEGAASLASGLEIEAVCDAVLSSLAGFYEKWRACGFAPIREAWLERAEHLGQRIRVGKPPQERYGIFEGLTAEGFLVFRPEKGKGPEEISAGPVDYGA